MPAAPHVTSLPPAAAMDMRRLHAAHAAQQRRSSTALAASLGALLGTQLRRLARTDAAVAELACGTQALVEDASAACSAASCSSSTAAALAAQHRRLLARFETACAAPGSSSSAPTSPLLPRALRRLLSRPEHAADALPLLLEPHTLGQLLRVLARAAGAAAAGRFAERRLLRLVAAQQAGAQKAHVEQAVLELLDALHALALCVPGGEGGSADMDMTAALELALLGVLREAPPEPVLVTPRRPPGSTDSSGRHVSAPLGSRPSHTRPRRGSSPSQPGSPRTAQWHDAAAEVWAGLGKGVESIASLTGGMTGFFAPKSPAQTAAADASRTERKPPGAPASLSLSRFISPASASLATPPASPMSKRTVSGSTLAALSEDSTDAHATFAARPGDAAEALAAVGGEERVREIRVSEILPPPQQAAPDVSEVLRALARGQGSGTPLVKWLLWRMLYVHHPPSDAAMHRPLLLLLLVRWYAFTHLRRLICAPPQQSATPAPTLSLGRDAGDGQTPASPRTARFFEGTWLQGGRELRALGETHRAVYADVVRALGLGTSAASTEAQHLVATFAHSVELQDEPLQSVQVLPLRNAEAAEVLLLLEPLLVASSDAQQNADPSELHAGSSPQPNGTPKAAAGQARQPKLHIETSPDPAAAGRAVTHEHVAAAAQALRDAGDELSLLFVGAKEKDKLVVSWTLEGLDEQLSAAKAQAATQTISAGDAVHPQPLPLLSNAGATVPFSAAGSALPQSHTSSSISTLARGASGDSGWGSPPHTPDERDEFQFEPAASAALAAAAPTPLSSSLETRRSGSETASPPTRRPSRRSANAPSSWRAALGSEAFSLAPPPPAPAREPELGEELFDEVRRGLVGVLRKGYCTDLSRLPLDVLRSAELAATQSHAFDDAALFARTTTLLEHIAATFPSLRGSAPSEEATFAPLLERIAAPLRAADAAAEQAVQLATLRLREVELHRVALMERAREAYTTAHEARTRVWYAAEVRTVPAFRDSLELARSRLHAADAPAHEESGEEWMQRLGVYDFGLPPPLQAYMRDLDGAFGVIAGDAGAFFAHDLFAREASLALPYLRGVAGAEEQDDTAVLTFGACPPSLLLPGETKAAARVALDEFLQRTQLLATGYFLSEALSHLPVVANPAATAAPSGVSQALLAELRSAGAPELLRRFELHPAPRAKMRALLVLERLVVALLSRSTDAAAAGGARPRAASVVSLAKARHRRAQSKTRDSPPLSAVSSTRPLSLRSPARARRALSMYDDEDDEEASSAGSPLEGKGIHALLDRLLKGGGGTEPAASAPAEAEQPPQQRLRETSAPTTDDVVGVLEGLLADAACRPRDLFLHLQLVAAFTPAALLSFREEAFCFWNLGCAALAVAAPTEEAA